MEKKERILTAILDAGEIMLSSGGEISRVESTIEHMAGAYGFVRADVFAVISSILVTVHDREGNSATQSRRIPVRDTNMRKVERINALSRQVCREPLPLEELEREITDIRQAKGYPAWLIFLMYGMISASFTIFFGGSWGDGIASFLSGLVMRIVQLLGTRLKIQSIILNIFCSGTAALVGIATVYLGLAQSVDMIVIGNIMPLIPGIAMTVSLRDLLWGDFISGLSGLCEALIKALAIAAGPALVIWQLGGLL